MKELGYGEAYAYAHNYEGNFIAHEFLPEEIKGYLFLHPWKQSEGKFVENTSQKPLEK
jgi:putative ATPase